MTRKLNCEDVIARLLEHLDGETDPAFEREVARHIAGCLGCRTRAQFERQLRHRLKDSGDAAAPGSLRRRVQAMLKES